MTEGPSKQKVAWQEVLDTPISKERNNRRTAFPTKN
jgi:hypothetical protein